MTRYVVRVNCEYSRVVDARDAEAAIADAERVDVASWQQAWSQAEAESDEIHGCDACGAEPGERCRPMCIGEAAHQDALAEASGAPLPGTEGKSCGCVKSTFDGACIAPERQPGAAPQ